MFGSGQIAGQRPRPKSLLIYISWYSNGYGHPGTSSDVNPKIRPVHGQVPSTGGVLLATTEQMTISHVPSADQYPRRGDGRKGAYRCRMRWRQRHPCPRHHDDHSGQDEGTGQEQGRAWQTNGQQVRAVHVPYAADTYGLSRLITVSRNRWSMAVSCPGHVVPKL
jgi:hypothetical protein